ncbi:MAG: ABC transporter substrate-binding protein [Actinomycetota bacterium]|nr:ABC transporter substrate-binding protein [Actinomycetota bacterium]
MNELQFAMDRRRFLAVALGSVGAVALDACTGQATKHATSGPVARPALHLPHGAFGFPSPFASNGGPGYTQMSLLYDTLLWKDGSGDLLPWLAKSVTRSADNLTYTFELRNNIKWSDGSAFSADDVAFTFDYYAHQQMLPPPVIIQPPQGIAKVTAKGPNTVEINLSAPDVTFAEQVAAAVPIIPRHVWSTVKDPAAAQSLKMLVGTGAYRLDSYKGDGSPLLYSANDSYFLGKPFAKRISFTDVDDEFSAVLSGALDAGGTFAAGVRSEVLAPFKRDKRFGLISQQGDSTTSLYWNLRRGGALANVAFRRACAMAIDRKDLVKRLAGGHGEPGNPGFLSPDNRFFAPVPQYDFDVAGAKSLLDSAGYREGAGGTRTGPHGPLKFDLLVSNQSVPLAELVVAALKAIGVTLTPKPVQGGPQLFGPKFSGQYEMALLGYPGPTAGGPNADPDLLRQVFSSHGPPSLTGATGYFNPAFEGLAQKQRMTFDDGERKGLVEKMQKIIADDLPILPLYYPETFLAYRKAVLDQWYFTPGQYPTSDYNKQLLITGLKTGSKIRATKK